MITKIIYDMIKSPTLGIGLINGLTSIINAINRVILKQAIKIT